MPKRPISPKSTMKAVILSPAGPRSTVRGTPGRSPTKAIRYRNVAKKIRYAKPPKTTNSTRAIRSEEHTSELQSLMRISYAVFCLKKQNDRQQPIITKHQQKIHK